MKRAIGLVFYNQEVRMTDTRQKTFESFVCSRQHRSSDLEESVAGTLQPQEPLYQSERHGLNDVLCVLDSRITMSYRRPVGHIMLRL